MKGATLGLWALVASAPLAAQENCADYVGKTFVVNGGEPEILFFEEGPNGVVGESLHAATKFRVTGESGDEIALVTEHGEQLGLKCQLFLQRLHAWLGQRILQGDAAQSGEEIIAAQVAKDAAVIGEQERQQRAENARALAKQRKRDADAKAAWLARGPAKLGMTEDQVLASNWGIPDHKNRTVTPGRDEQQWVYGSRGNLYFTNGVLTAIQSSE